MIKQHNYVVGDFKEAIKEFSILNYMNIIIASLFIIIIIYSFKNSGKEIRELSEYKDIGVSVYLKVIIGGIGAIILGIFILYKEIFSGGFNW